ncbi:MAG: hypothetical protein HY053_00690 [Proteobacteria bacterium]|nr:hypothetical protein [Pseudomonadota bacterium]
MAAAGIGGMDRGIAIDVDCNGTAVGRNVDAGAARRIAGNGGVRHIDRNVAAAHAARRHYMDAVCHARNITSIVDGERRTHARNADSIGGRIAHSNRTILIDGDCSGIDE